MSFLTAHVHAPPGRGGLLGKLPFWTDMACGEQLNDADRGSITVRVDTPALVDNPDMLAHGNIVKISVGNGPPRAAFEIQKKTLTVVDTDEGRTLAVVVAGSGIGNLARSWPLYPETGLHRLSLEDRIFTWGSVLAGTWYDPAAWRPVVSSGTYAKPGNPWAGSPSGFPAASAQWIWDRRNTAAGVPQGDVYFRGLLVLGAAATVTIWATIDNYGEIYVDGHQVIRMHEDVGWTWNGVATGSIQLPPGPHIISARGQNRGSSASVVAGAGGLLLAAGIANAAGAMTKLLKVSDESWRCIGYPTEYPGWSIGDLWTQAMGEAAVAGFHGADIPLGFTGTADSDGLPWGPNLPWSFPVGASYREMLDATASVADWAFSPVDYQFGLWKRRGQDRTLSGPGMEPVILRPARNVTKAETESSFEPTNVLIARSSDGFHEITEAGVSKARYGKRGGFLAAADQSPAVLGKLAEQAFTEKAYPQSSPSIEIIATPGATPWEDFEVGDTVLAPADSLERYPPLIPRRVMSISAGAKSDTGEPVYTIEIDSIEADRADRQARWLASIGPGTLAGVVAAAGKRATPSGMAAQLGGGSMPGGGTLGVRAVAEAGTDNIGAGVTEQTAITLAHSYTLYQITASGPARVRLYASLPQQAADVNRPAEVAPAGDHGVLLDVTLTATSLARAMTPALGGASLDTPPSVNIPITVTNLGPGPAAVTVTATFMATG